MLYHGLTELMETSSSNTQKIPEIQKFQNEGRALLLFLSNSFWLQDRSQDDDIFMKTTFPVKVKIEPCAFSATVNIELNLGVNMSGEGYPLNEYIARPSERLTLRKIDFHNKPN